MKPRKHRTKQNRTELIRRSKSVGVVIVLLMLIILNTISVSAQTPTATLSGTITPTVTSTVSDKEIENLKEKIASKVAELNKNKKAVSGAITDISNNSLKIKDDQNTDMSVKIDQELTKIYSLIGGVKKELKLADLKKTNYIIVSGVLLDNSVNANYIYLDEAVLVKSGKITEVDKGNFSFKVMTTDKDNYTITVENYTKQEIMNIKTLDVERVGFSKIKEGDTIHFVVKADSDLSDKNNYTILRYLVIPQEYFLK